MSVLLCSAVYTMTCGWAPAAARHTQCASGSASALGLGRLQWLAPDETRALRGKGLLSLAYHRPLVVGFVQEEHRGRRLHGSARLGVPPQAAQQHVAPGPEPPPRRAGAACARAEGRRLKGRAHLSKKRLHSLLTHLALQPGTVGQLTLCPRRSLVRLRCSRPTPHPRPPLQCAQPGQPAAARAAGRAGLGRGR